ncbi:hypothetical protein FA13DRAFT_1716753 [Coprinellus micaceus]|uniref:Uncharacterized protein n=1 Tax=Coprinellus micaceus TaxID=71717 RepID=A0A4Y7SIJ0_COPMI|nr:hypothetical protein FA13DRAFT_1716753 [Coprinellus micaceus]
MRQDIRLPLRQSESINVGVRLLKIGAKELSANVELSQSLRRSRRGLESCQDTRASETRVRGGRQCLVLMLHGTALAGVLSLPSCSTNERPLARPGYPNRERRRRTLRLMRDAYPHPIPTSSRRFLLLLWSSFRARFLTPTTPALHQRLRMAIRSGKLRADGLWAFRPASWPRQTCVLGLGTTYTPPARDRWRTYLIIKFMKLVGPWAPSKLKTRSTIRPRTSRTFCQFNSEVFRADGGNSFKNPSLRSTLDHQMRPAKKKSSKAKPKPKVQPLQSRRSKRAEKVTAAHPDDIESFPAPPRLSIQPSQLKFLMICSVYLRQAQAEGQDEEFLDQFFNRVYHPRWPIPRHEFFCEEAAEHAKGVLFKMVRKELFWLLPFAGSVAVNMTWEEFVVLGERGLSRDKGFGEELERIRLVLRGRRGPNNLTFIQNPWGFGLLAYVRATQTTSATPLRARTSPVQFTPPGALSHKAARKGNGIKDSGENVTHWWLSVATRKVYYQGQNREALPMRMTSWFPLGCGNIRPHSDHGKVRLCAAPACGLLNAADSRSDVSVVAAYATSLHRRLPGMLGLPDGKYRKECATRVDRNEEKGIWCGGNLGTKDVPSTYGADRPLQRNSVPLDRPLDQENAVGGQIDDHQTSLVPNSKQSYSPNFDVHDVQRVASHASPQQGLHVGVVQSGPTRARSLVRLHHTGPRRLAPWHDVYTQLDANEYRMSLSNLKSSFAPHANTLQDAS